MRKRMFHERYTIVLAIVAAVTFIFMAITQPLFPYSVFHQLCTLMTAFSSVAAVILFPIGEIKRYVRYKKMVRRYGYL